jgi:hypothetical protein
MSYPLDPLDCMCVCHEADDNKIGFGGWCQPCQTSHKDICQRCKKQHFRPTTERVTFADFPAHESLYCSCN